MLNKRIRRGLFLGMIVPLTVSLAACSQGASARPATVRGLAAGCQNPLEVKLQPITVVAKRDGQVVKKTTARFTDFRSRYRLVLRPGQYTISDPLSGAPPREVTLSAGSTTTLNFPNDC